jgi:hypothetical protein
MNSATGKTHFGTIRERHVRNARRPPNAHTAAAAAATKAEPSHHSPNHRTEPKTTAQTAMAANTAIAQTATQQLANRLRTGSLCGLVEPLSQIDVTRNEPRDAIRNQPQSSPDPVEHQRDQSQRLSEQGPVTCPRASHRPVFTLWHHKQKSLPMATNSRTPVPPRYCAVTHSKSL